MMEVSMKSFQKEIDEMKNKKTSGLNLSYAEALEKVQEGLKEKLSSEALAVATGLETAEEVSVKDKEYLRQQEAKYRELISDIVSINNIKVPEFQDNRPMLVDKLVASCVGFDVLDAAMKNPNVSDIYVISPDTIFVEENGENKEYPYHFRDLDHLYNFIMRLVTEAGVSLNLGKDKKADFELYGDRYCATSQAMTPLSPSLTIRKHAEDHVTFEQLIEQNVIDTEIADLLNIIISGERNIVMGGLTGSGKTTSLRAFLDEIVTNQNKRMLVCEDTQELFPQNKHTLQMISSKTGDPETEISMYDLVIIALRLKPKYIVVGEARDKEMLSVIEAMETGHATLLTGHADTALNWINRMVTKYLAAAPSLSIEVIERMIGSSLDYICIQDCIPGIGRKVTEISEISYDFKNRCIDIKPIYIFDLKTEEFKRVGNISETKANLIMRRGVKYPELEKWLEKEA